MENRTLRRIRRNTRCTYRLVKQFNLELEHDDDGYRKYHWMPRDRSVIYVAYLTHDPLCSDPISGGDCNGKIITKHEDRSFLQHVGRDTDGEPDLEPFVSITCRLMDIEDDGMNDLLNAAYEMAEAMWYEASKQNKVGTKYARALSYIDHRGYVESESEGRRRQIEAVWIPDDALLDEMKEYSEEERTKRMSDRFEAVIEEYNKWVTGDCWGVTVDKFKRIGPNEYERTENDSCWGYIGHDYALEEASGNLSATRKYFLANHGKKEHACENKCPPGPAGQDDRHHLGAA